MSNSSTSTSTPSYTRPSTQSPTSYLTEHVSPITTSFYSRLTDQAPSRSRSPSSKRSVPGPSEESTSLDPHNGIYTPPHSNASPFQPPPLTPLTLSGTSDSTVLSKAIAEEIRLLVPPRLQLSEQWRLVYSLDRDGVSLATLYHKCASPTFDRGYGFVVVIQDAAGGVRSKPPLLSLISTIFSLHETDLLYAYHTHRSSAPT